MTILDTLMLSYLGAGLFLTLIISLFRERFLPEDFLEDLRKEIILYLVIIVLWLPLVLYVKLQGGEDGDN